MMVYENSHKKVLGIWFDLEKYSKILIFKAIFLHQKSAESFYNFVSLKNTKTTYFDNFDFQSTLFSNNVPKF